MWSLTFMVDSKKCVQHVPGIGGADASSKTGRSRVRCSTYVEHYIQHWLKTEKEIPNHSAARIFAAATSILKAGTPAAGEETGQQRNCTAAVSSLPKNV